MKLEQCKHEEKKFAISIIDQDVLFETLKEYLQGDAKLVVWFNHRVVFGKYEAGALVWAEGFEFAPKQFLELRAFNKREELYLHDGVGRYIADSDGDGTEYVDSFSQLWGNEVTSSENGFITLEDKGRKLQLVVPADNGDMQELWLRSYVGMIDKTGQASYVAWRYLDIMPAKRGEK